MAFLFADFDDVVAAPLTPPADVDKAIRWLDTNWSGADSFDEEATSLHNKQTTSFSVNVVSPLKAGSSTFVEGGEGTRREKTTVAARQPGEVPPNGQATPPTSSPSREENGPNGQQHLAKKIRFSPFTSEIPTALTENYTVFTTPTSAMKLSKKKTVTTKSILKPTISSPGQKSVIQPSFALTVPSDTACFSDFLDSVVKELEGDSRSSRLDAYLALSGYLKEYTEIPEPQGFVERIGFLEHCLRRDIKMKNLATELLDGDLISQALKLTLYFFRTPAILSRISRDFISDLTEDSIAALKCPTASKKIVQCYLRILAQTPLLKTGLTASRCNKIIDGLADLELRHTGNQMASFRLTVYHLLLVNASQYMLAKVDDWMPLVFLGLLSSVAEIRTSAINTSIKAGVKIGSTDRGASATLAVLDQEWEEMTILKGLELQTKKLLDEREHGHHVPRIWTALILLVRSKKYSFQQSPHFMNWMKIIQRCFNSSDQSVNLAAYMAWDRLTYITRPDQNTSMSVIRRLSQPIIVGMTPPKVPSKNSGVVNNAAFASYCNFLYYAFRPHAPVEQIDLYWVEFVEKVFNEHTVTNKSLAYRACRVLNAMFTNAPGTPWQMNRLIEGKYPVRPEEIPRLPASWIRRKLPAIMKVVGLILKHSKWTPTVDGRTEAEKLWTNLMRAVSEASAKEIKASKDLKDATALCINMFYSMRNNHSDFSIPDDDPPNVFRAKFVFLISAFAECLGPLHLSSKIMLRASDGLFEANFNPVIGERNSSELVSPIEALVPLMALLQGITSSKHDEKLSRLFGLSFEALSWLQTSNNSPQVDMLPISSLKNRISQNDIRSEDWQTLVHWATCLGCKFNDDVSKAENFGLGYVKEAFLQENTNKDESALYLSTDEQSSDDDLPPLDVLINDRKNNAVPRGDPSLALHFNAKPDDSRKNNDMSDGDDPVLSSGSVSGKDVETSPDFTTLCYAPGDSSPIEDTAQLSVTDTDLELVESSPLQTSDDSFFDCPSSLDVHAKNNHGKNDKFSEQSEQSKQAAQQDSSIVEDADKESKKATACSESTSILIKRDEIAETQLGLQSENLNVNPASCSEIMTPVGAGSKKRFSSEPRNGKASNVTDETRRSLRRSESLKRRNSHDAAEEEATTSKRDIMQNKRRRTRSAQQDSSLLNANIPEPHSNHHELNQDDLAEAEANQSSLDLAEFDGECIRVAPGPSSPISDATLRATGQLSKPVGRPRQGTKRARQTESSMHTSELSGFEDKPEGKRRKSERLSKQLNVKYEGHPEDRVSAVRPTEHRPNEESPVHERAPRIPTPALRSPSREHDLALMQAAPDCGDQEDESSLLAPPAVPPAQEVEVTTDNEDLPPGSPSPKSHQNSAGPSQNDLQENTLTVESPQSSMGSSMIARMKSILADCKKLVLGTSEMEERRTLRDLAVDIQFEIVRAVGNVN